MELQPSPERELILAWIEEACADMTPTKRAKRVLRFMLNLHRRAGAPCIREPERAAAAAEALEAVNRNIVRLLG